MCQVIECYYPKCGHFFKIRLVNRCHAGFSSTARSCKRHDNRVIAYRPLASDHPCEECGRDRLRLLQRVYRVYAGEVQAHAQGYEWPKSLISEVLRRRMDMEQRTINEALDAFAEYDAGEDAQSEAGDWSSEDSDDESQSSSDLQFGDWREHDVFENDPASSNTESMDYPSSDEDELTPGILRLQELALDIEEPYTKPDRLDSCLTRIIMPSNDLEDDDTEL